MVKNLRAKSTGKQRAELVPEDFNTLIDQQGVYVKITPVLVCPNKESKYGTNHDLDCPLCFGKQFIDVVEKSFCEWAFMQSIKIEKQLDVQGIWDVKDARISTKSSTRLYYQYKIELLDFESVFNELLERKTGDVDLLRYDAIKSCETGFIVIDKDRKFYEVDTDFRVEDRNLTWLGANRPTDLYTISYPVHPTFRVIELLNENRNYYAEDAGGRTPVNLPQQAVIRLDYLLENGGLEQR